MTVSRILIANRGEIAVRIIGACQKMGMETVLAASEADLSSLPAMMADRTICIGPAPADGSYLNIGAVMTAVEATSCDALHPGYGFLAESSALAEACEKRGIRFIGPSALHIRKMGNKIEARGIARQCNVPIVPGSKKLNTIEDAKKAAEEIGLPVIFKAAAGGGGRGMKIVNKLGDLAGAYTSASAEASASFGDGSLYLERYISRARHIEVQVLGDASGNVYHLWERDCSLQRRHQKLIEEAPAPNLSPELRSKICDSALDLAREINYESAGTVEFILDKDTGQFYFLEMNTRIQVEHPVTEAITGIDIVEQQINIASGNPLFDNEFGLSPSRHSIECRVNAEDPRNGFAPSPGRIDRWEQPEGINIRIDTHCFPGYEVPVYYDSLLAKVIVEGRDRRQAIGAMRDALARFKVSGIETNLAFLSALLHNKQFVSGNVDLALVGEEGAHWNALDTND